MKERKMFDRNMLNGKVINNEKCIADAFNDFYVDIGPTLGKKIPSQTKSPTLYINNTNLQSMGIEPVNSDEVQKVVLLKEILLLFSISFLWYLIEIKIYILNSQKANKEYKNLSDCWIHRQPSTFKMSLGL